MTKRIPYRFTCYNCGEDSGWRYLLFEARESIKQRSRIFAYNVTESQQEKTQDKANALLGRMITAQKGEVEKGIYRTVSEMLLPAFDDKCPFCNKRQAWNKDKNQRRLEPEINWDYIDAEQPEADNNDFTSQHSPIKYTIKNENYDFYETLAAHPHINLQNVLSVTSNDEYDIVIEKEYVEGERLSERLKYNITIETLNDYLLQICDITEHLQGLSLPLMFESLEMDDIIVCENNLLKITNLELIQPEIGSDASLNLAAKMIRQVPRKAARYFDRFLANCGDQLPTIDELRAEILDIPKRQKRLVLQIVFGLLVISLIFRRIIVRFF
jgi:hypothetical protein